MEISQEQLDSITDAIKGLARDFERRTKILADLIEGNAADYKEELALRDLVTDDILAHKRKADIVIDLFRQFHKTTKEVRAEFEKEINRDVTIGDLEWFARHVAAMNRADMEDAARIDALNGRVTDLSREVAELKALLQNAPVANETH